MTDQLNESSLSRLWRKMQEFDTGTITAFRYAEDCGNGRVFTKKENKQRNKSLQAKLLRLGYTLTSVKGSYIENYGSSDAREVGESVWFVVDSKDKGNLERDLKKLGEEFDQDSILFIPAGGKEGRLVGTSKCPNAFPDYGKAHKLKNPVFGQAGEFFTRVNGRPFTLKEGTEQDVELIVQPRGMTARWGLKLTANSPWNELDINDED